MENSEILIQDDIRNIRHVGYREDQDRGKGCDVSFLEEGADQEATNNGGKSTNNFNVIRPLMVFRQWC